MPANYDLKIKKFLKLRSEGWSLCTARTLSSINHSQHWKMMTTRKNYRDEVLKYMFNKNPNHFKYKVWLEKYYLDISK